ncbi:glycerol-3-phosphate responsive antiterminator GlpP [Bacillus sp. V3-13]|uniref:glycerol-3-phosphate responsive antiterminator n=1 Tax=Bacillus sp. V3-13 TaxID=2053728 RepID=UPI000C794925|nr:glycerol-3-phosphate responsive antiterminator [Bacillus sp. V3-13]PLR75920.1 glycerol-3-phosphate responsive antiterminator GlpP [Bacillus sp. V3-13]
MSFHGQQIIPAAKNMKQFELFLESSCDFGVLLEIHIAQLKHVSQMACQCNKKILIHADLVHGLKNDEYATEFLCQEIKPFGIISTRPNVIVKAKQKGVLAIQRIFLLDSQAMERGYSLLKTTKADYVEVLPGIIPRIIRQMSENINIPILAGGLVQTEEEVASAIHAGAIAVTTSRVELWKKAI